MCSTAQFVVFVALAASAFGAITPVYNVSSGLEDYTLLTGRHMQNDLDIGELQLATVRARHADRIESITNQQQLVKQEIQKIDNSLVQEQALSIPRKHCVQKFKPRLTTMIEANNNFTLCNSDAEVSAKRLTTNAEYALANARRIREKDVPAIFPYCNISYVLDSNKENCVTTRIEQQVGYFNTYMDVFQANLQESLYTSSVIAAEANHCSFAVEKKVLTAYGAVSDLADVCVQEMVKSDTSVHAIENENAALSRFMQKQMLSNKLIN